MTLILNRISIVYIVCRNQAPKLYDFWQSVEYSGCYRLESCYQESSCLSFTTSACVSGHRGRWNWYGVQRNLILLLVSCTCQVLDEHELAGEAAVEYGVDAAVDIGHDLEQYADVHHCLLVLGREKVELAEHLRYVEWAVRYDEADHDCPQHSTETLLVDLAQTALRVAEKQFCGMKTRQ